MRLWEGGRTAMLFGTAHSSNVPKVGRDFVLRSPACLVLTRQFNGWWLEIFRGVALDRGIGVIIQSLSTLLRCAHRCTHRYTHRYSHRYTHRICSPIYSTIYSPIYTLARSKKGGCPHRCTHRYTLRKYSPISPPDRYLREHCC